jgi:hypothetical protein
VKKPKLPIVRMVLYVPVSLSLCAAGLAAFVIPFPFIWVLSLPCLWFSAWPYARWMSKKIHADIAYANRDKPLVEDTPEWDMTDPIDEELLEILINNNGRGKRND